MPFSTIYEHDTRLLRLRMSGFWDDRICSEYERHTQALAARNAHRAGGGKVLLDLRDFQVQPADIMARIIANTQSVATRVDRFAVVWSGSAIQRLQLARVLPTGSFEIFAHADDALVWLALGPNVAADA